MFTMNRVISQIITKYSLSPTSNIDELSQYAAELGSKTAKWPESA
jgi:hypothetical protein